MISRGPKLITKNLQVYLDTSNENSYPRTGNDWFDLSGNNNNSTLYNSVGYDTRILGLLTFDGSSNYAELSPITSSKTEYTLSSWLYIDDFDVASEKTNSGRVFLRNIGDNINNMIVFFDGGFSFETNTNSNPHEIANRTSGHVVSSDIVTGSWFNFSLVFSSSNFYGYTNGNLNGSGSISDDLLIDRFGDSTGYATTYPSNFKGKVSDLMFYSKALTSKEIVDNYNAKKSKFSFYVPDQTNYFITTWKTDNSGVSSTNQIKLPLVSSGTYDMVVDWGDGSSDTITTYNQAETTHTYSSTGTYTVKISGTCRGWQFNNGGDRAKILSVDKWGILDIKDSAAFYGCTNLNSTATDSPTISATSLSRCFRGCSSLTGGLSGWNFGSVTDLSEFLYTCSSYNEDISGWDVSNITSMSRVFSLATSFNQNINNWDTSNVTRMDYMFQNATSFNQNISSWDVSSVTSFEGMFRSATSFNQDISSWNTIGANVMAFMFRDATSFDQNLAAWNITNVQRTIVSATYRSMDEMFRNVTLSTANYDAILVGWESQLVNNDIVFHGGNSKYSAGSAAATARANLIADHNWTITDGGSI